MCLASLCLSLHLHIIHHPFSIPQFWGQVPTLCCFSSTTVSPHPHISTDFKESSRTSFPFSGFLRTHPLLLHPLFRRRRNISTNSYQDLNGTMAKQSPLSWPDLESGKQIFGGSSEGLAKRLSRTNWPPVTKAQVKLAKAETKEKRQNLWTHLTEKAGFHSSNNVTSILYLHPLSIFPSFSASLPHMVTKMTTSRTRLATPAERKCHLPQSFNPVQH